VAQAGDRLRFLDRGVVLPQHEHGVGVVANSSRSASTLPSASMGAGVEPVLSTPIPTSARCSALSDASTLFSAASIDSI
jgi:hypothetical protein